MIPAADGGQNEAADMSADIQRTRRNFSERWWQSGDEIVNLSDRKRPIDEQPSWRGAGAGSFRKVSAGFTSRPTDEDRLQAMVQVPRQQMGKTCFHKLGERNGHDSSDR